MEAGAPGTPSPSRAEACFLCGGGGEVLHRRLGDRHFSVPGRWDIRWCPACAVSWLDPLPRAEEIAGFYANYYTHGAEVAGGELRGLRRLLKLCLPAVVFGYALEMTGPERLSARLLSLVGPVRDMAGPQVMWLPGARRGRLLDVGSGDGELIARMRSLGWDVRGLEPDPEAARVAREVRGLEVTVGALETADLPEAGWDAVTANHVLEHVLDPVAMLRQCARALRPGGTVVVTTPNAVGLGQRRFGPAWLHWDPPRHIHCFGPRSLRGCAERAGLRVERLLTAANLARSTWKAGRQLRREGTLPGLQITGGGPAGMAGSVAFWLLEYALSRFTACGENLVLVARKEDDS